MPDRPIPGLGLTGSRAPSARPARRCSTEHRSVATRRSKRQVHTGTRRCAAPTEIRARPRTTMTSACGPRRRAAPKSRGVALRPTARTPRGSRGLRVRRGAGLFLRGGRVGLLCRGLVVEVPVPTVTLEQEITSRNQALGLRGVALRTVLHRIFGDPLFEFPGMATSLAAVIIRRHRSAAQSKSRPATCKVVHLLEPRIGMNRLRFPGLWLAARESGAASTARTSPRCCPFALALHPPSDDCVRASSHARGPLSEAFILGRFARAS